MALLEVPVALLGVLGGLFGVLVALFGVVVVLLGVLVALWSCTVLRLAPEAIGDLPQTQWGSPPAQGFLQHEFGFPLHKGSCTLRTA